jgi:pyrroline-5-carboxylate reductase
VTLSTKRIGFVGGGAMAEALAGGLIAGGVAAERVGIAEPRAERRRQLAEQLAVATFDDNAQVIRDRDLVVLAVKPDVVVPALEQLRASALDLTRPLWISIAAGIRLTTIESCLPAGCRVVRAMPNIPALVGAGATALCGNQNTDAADLADARSVFDSVGVSWEAEREALLDAVTGLSGSGPAYAFLFLEALIDAGEGVGLPREAAEKLALQTVFGAAKLALESDKSPAQLREQVSSPGGTTLAGLAQLEDGRMRETIARAVAAATRRSAELGET